ncbi:MAG: hypothetical protein LBS73_00845 [Campylobacteraceae bacterium]|jgi:Zn-dependent oligopeptidase|nr:hypothetical protein [Campylobacteraceae bacterium]
MEQIKFDIVNEKLNTIKELNKEIEAFMHKQSELFAVLNEKFPKIEQFSNALKDANELFMFIENITECADTSLDELKNIQLLYVSEREKEEEARAVLKEKLKLILLKIE